MFHIFLIHCSDKRHLGCFQLLVMTNNGAMNIIERMSSSNNWTSFEYIPKSYIAWSWWRLFPNFLRYGRTVSHRGWIILDHYRNAGVFPLRHNFSSKSCQHAFDLGHSYRCKMESHSTLFCISLMVMDIEHCFRCVSAIYIPLLIVLCLGLYSLFLVGLFILLMINLFLCPLYILELSPLSDVGLVKIFSILYAVLLSCLPCPLLYKRFSVLYGST